MRIKDALQWGRSRLLEACERPQYEAELLLTHHLNKDRTYLLIHEEDEVGNIEAFKTLVQRRAKHEPYEYIVGEVSFYDTYLYTAPHVLIARPETEILVDKASEVIEREGITELIEIGIGSGAISVILARKFPDLRIIATDISEDALALAQRNIDRHGLQERIELKRTSILDGIGFDAQMVVSNPPYIAEDFLLEKNVGEYEPHTALFGGEKGDELLKEIIMDVKKRGIKWLACEMGYDQREPILEFVNEIGVKSIDFYKDLAGFDRGFVLAFP